MWVWNRGRLLESISQPAASWSQPTWQTHLWQTMMETMRKRWRGRRRSKPLRETLMKWFSLWTLVLKLLSSKKTMNSWLPTVTISNRFKWKLTGLKGSLMMLSIWKRKKRRFKAWKANWIKSVSKHCFSEIWAKCIKKLLRRRNWKSMKKIGIRYFCKNKLLRQEMNH